MSREKFSKVVDCWYRYSILLIVSVSGDSPVTSATLQKGIDRSLAWYKADSCPELLFLFLSIG